MGDLDLKLYKNKKSGKKFNLYGYFYKGDNKIAIGFYDKSKKRATYNYNKFVSLFRRAE